MQSESFKITLVLVFISENLTVLPERHDKISPKIFLKAENS